MDSFEIPAVRQYFAPVRRGRSDTHIPDLFPFLEQLPQECDFLQAKHDMRIAYNVAYHHNKIALPDAKCIPGTITLKGHLYATEHGAEFTKKSHVPGIFEKDGIETWYIRDGKLIPQMVSRFWNAFLVTGAAVNQTREPSDKALTALRDVFMMAQFTQYDAQHCIKALEQRLALA